MWQASLNFVEERRASQPLVAEQMSLNFAEERRAHRLFVLEELYQVTNFREEVRLEQLLKDEDVVNAVRIVVVAVVQGKTVLARERTTSPWNGRVGMQMIS